jgi:hypothetical protein
MVRSNLLHRGKSAFRDAELVRVSLVELHDALRSYLLERFPEFGHVWRETDDPAAAPRWWLGDSVEPPLDLVAEM